MVATPSSPFTTSEDWFDSAGTRCAVRIYRPAASGSPRPVIVMAHGFGGVRGLRLYAYAERFVAEGYVVAVFDYRGFGESEGEPRQVLSVRRQHEDWRAALSYARSVDGVDPDRVVAWGTSFSGGHVISLAGQGEPLTAIIAQVPHVSGPAAVKSAGAMTAVRLAIPGIRDVIGSRLGRGPVYVSSIDAPGKAGMMTSPDALPGIRKLFQESGLTETDYPQVVAARIALTIGSYSPKRWASRVQCPALVQIVSADAITPRSVAEKVAATMRRSTVRLYDGGHFDPYVEPMFGSVVADQIAFLAEHVPVDATA